MPGSGMQYDEQGRAYFLNPATGKRVYVSPVAMGEQAPEDNTGIFRSRPEWDQSEGKWETPIDWGNIASLGVGAGLGGGIAHALGAFGGGSGAAAGGAGTGGAGTAGGLSTPASVLPAAGGGMLMDSGGEALLNAGKEAGGGFLKNLLGGGDNGLASLLPVLLPLLARIGGGNQGPSDEMRQIQDLTRRRMQAQNPLFEAASKTAFSRLPIASRQGLREPSLTDPELQAFQKLAGGS